MQKTHWKKWSNPKYIGSWDFMPGEEKVLIIDRVEHEELTDATGKIDTKPVLYFSEDVKPLICNKTNAETISEVLGTPYIEDWPGKGIILSVQKVQTARGLTDGIRVRPVKPYECENCGKPIKGNEEETAMEVKNRIKKKYGKVLCPDCVGKIDT